MPFSTLKMYVQSIYCILCDQGPESGHSSDYDNIQPMDEEELQRQLKLSTEKPDIYDTGMLWLFIPCIGCRCQ
jgi:hypothetical protein